MIVRGLAADAVAILIQEVAQRIVHIGADSEAVIAERGLRIEHYFYKYLSR